MSATLVRGLYRAVQMFGSLPGNRLVLLVGDGEKFSADSESLLYMTEEGVCRKVETRYTSFAGGSVDSFIGLRLTASGKLLAYYAGAGDGTWFFDDRKVQESSLEQFEFDLADGKLNEIVVTARS